MSNTKAKQIIPISKEERKLAVLKSQQEKEKVFKLMVKIISWESGSAESTTVQSVNKITKDEWMQYKKQRMGIITSYNKDEIMKKLTQTYNSILENGGFE